MKEARTRDEEKEKKTLPRDDLVPQNSIFHHFSNLGRDISISDYSQYNRWICKLEPGIASPRSKLRIDW